MQVFEKELAGNPTIEHAGPDAMTDSTTHGGFDNDAATMNTILSRILGKPAAEPFNRNSWQASSRTR
jgi:hypothetical protein